MTLKVFRDAYLATKALRQHGFCSRCEHHNVWGGPPCLKALPYVEAIDKADRLLGLKKENA